MMLRHIDFMLKHPMNAGRPISTLARFASWQARSRLAGNKPIEVRWFDDVKLIANRGMHGLTGNIYNGLQELQDMGFLLHFLRPGDFFVDIGANVGCYTVLALSCHANVLAFEPGERFDDLRRNVEANGAAADLRRAAVGSKSGTLKLTIGQDCQNHAARDGEAFVEVPMAALDDVCVRPPTFIKIDVEGFEHEVFAGGKDTIARAEAVMVESFWQTERIVEWMSSVGFRHVDYDPFARELLPPTARGNCLFVRGDTLARLKSAPRRRINGKLI